MNQPTTIANPTDDFKHRLFMFVVLSNEASKWAYTMKGNVKYEFHAMLNNYLTASSRLERYCNKFIDMDKVEDVAEVMSRMVEMLTSENRDRKSTRLNSSHSSVSRMPSSA